MADYIERAAVEHMLEAAHVVSDAEGIYCGYFTEDVRLSEIPSVDVAPVRYGQWINTEEELPEEGNVVLANVNGKPAKNFSLVGAYEFAEWSSGGWILQAWPLWEGAEVTHWMPLPEPPEDRTTK